MSVGIKDLISTDNVIKTYTHGKYICFVLKSGMIVKLNPNQTQIEGNEVKNGGN